MTKEECREIHPYPDTYNAMTQYYFSYQMDLYKLGILYVTDIQQSNEQSNFFPELQLIRMVSTLTCILQGQKPVPVWRRVDPHMG